MVCGPFATAGAYRAWLDAAADGGDPPFRAIFDLGSGRAAGVAAWLRIDPANGVLEIRHIALAPALQRTRSADRADAVPDLRFAASPAASALCGEVGQTGSSDAGWPLVIQPIAHSVPPRPVPERPQARATPPWPRCRSCSARAGCGRAGPIARRKAAA
jgi:hypothetical protein